MNSSNSRNEAVLICDTGPVLALARINFLPVLHELFPRCLLTEVVLAECLGKPMSFDALVIQESVKSNILDVVRAPPARAALTQLDFGERSVIEYALRHKAIALLDERHAREIARQLDVRVIGSIGVILLAKRKCYIDSAMYCIRRLVDSGYYLSPELVEQSRILAGE
jgi:predicted nucleic acid-binding protein